MSPVDDRRLLEAISRVHAGFLQTADARVAFADLLATLLELTGSGYGFIGEVLTDPEGAPYLKTQAITDISWDDATRAYFRDNSARGLDFRNLKTLFGAVMTTGRAVIANEPANDPRRGGLPPGHPPLDAFLGLPCFGGGQMIGMVGLANRPGGYSEELGRALEPLLSTCANLLVAHRAVRERRATSDALRRSEARLRLALQTGKLTVWDLDLVTNLVTLTDETNALIGDPGGPTERAYDDTYQRVHPDDRAAVSEALARCLRGDDGDDFAVESRTLPGPGMRHLASTGRVMRDEQGRAVRVLGTIRDVTAEKAMTLRMMQADRLAAVGTLAAGVGHEINNPLTFVQGNLESSLREITVVRGTVEDAPARALDEVLSLLGDATLGVERIAGIVRQLRVFSRVDERTQVIDVAAVVRLALRMAEHQLKNRAELTIELPALPPVRGQEGPLAQVFLNLLVNAVHALDGDGRALQIRVTGARDGERVVVSISDTGVGIPDDVLPHVFDPFFTTKDLSLGTGLGLAISRQIVTGHGGELQITSQVGVGTRADVILPVTVGEVAVASRTPSRPTHRAPVRILLVDDEALIARALTVLLEPDVVVACTSAPEALAHLERGERFDVVLCDLVMPRMTGMDLYRRVVESWPELAPRCLFMSGGAFTSEAVVFVQTSGRPCLDKPIDAASLQRAIDLALV